jgi:hypothetical protein
MNLTLLAVTLSPILVIAHMTFNVSLNDDQNCMERTIATLNLSVEDGCQTIGVGQTRSARIHFDGEDEYFEADHDSPYPSFPSPKPTQLLNSAPSVTLLQLPRLLHRRRKGRHHRLNRAPCVSIDGLSVTR